MKMLLSVISVASEVKRKARNFQDSCVVTAQSKNVTIFANAQRTPFAISSEHVPRLCDSLRNSEQPRAVHRYEPYASFYFE